jgi:two-component system, LytTR family, response regulator
MEPIKHHPLSFHGHDLLILPTNTGIQLIDVNAIICVQSISNYSKLFFSNGKTLVVAKVLKWFEESLCSHQFIRVHRTHLVNRNFIHQYRRSGSSKLRLVNGDWIDVSRRKKMFVQQYLYSITA